MRAAAPVLLALAALVPAGPAGAAVRLAPDARVHALAVSGGAAHAVVDSGDPGIPFTILRSQGGAPEAIAAFGERRAEFPDLAAQPDGTLLAAWALPISGGNTLYSGTVAAPAVQTAESGPATGPPRIAAAPEAPVLAFPDRDGDLALRGFGGGETAALSHDAPALRHHALDAAAGARGPLVLDLVQRRGHSSLRVVGEGIAPEPLRSIGSLRHLPGSIAAEGDLVAVGYLLGGRAYLATTRGAGWQTRRLRGRGGGRGAPSVAIAGGRVLVAYAQKVRRSREILLDDGGRARLLTRVRGDDRDPLLAAGPGGEAYVAWTRIRGGGPRALLLRVR